MPVKKAAPQEKPGQAGAERTKLAANRRKAAPSSPNTENAESAARLPVAIPHKNLSDLTRKVLLEEYAPAAVVINLRHEVLHYSGPTQLYLQQPGGPPSHDLLTLALAALRPRIRAAAVKTINEKARVDIGGIRIKRAGHAVLVRLSVQPLPSKLADEHLLLVIFQDEPEVPQVTDAGEELQSLNEGLSTINAQLRDKVDELENSNNDMTNLLASVDNALLFLGVDRTIQRFTPSATRLFNLIATDVGRPIDHITARFDDPELSRDIDRVLQDLAPCEREVSRGEEQWFLRLITPYRTTDNRISGVVLTLTDITALKRAELDLRNLTAHLEQRVSENSAQLQHERNFIDAILNTVGALILVIDTEERVVRFNTACNTITGHDFAEFQDSAAWRDLVPADEQDGVRRVNDRLRSGEDHIQHENHWLHRDGSMRLISWCNSVLRDDAGQVQYIIGTGIDITEQRRAENQARETLEEASRLQRLQTANELATLLAHELNQPLAAIATYAETGKQILLHTPADHDKLAANLERISQQSLRAGEAIRHLRAFVGRGRIDPVPTDLNAVVRSTCTLMAPKARARDIDLALDLATLPPVLAVDVHIEQVLLNLLRNAIDAIRDASMSSGSITVTTRRFEGMAQVSVIDSGPGIDAAAVDKVFEPLASHKEYGLGVGLRISRSLIEAHGGRLWVEPHTPGGIFHFVLPFAP